MDLGCVVCQSVPRRCAQRDCVFARLISVEAINPGDMVQWLAYYNVNFVEYCLQKISSDQDLQLFLQSLALEYKICILKYHDHGFKDYIDNLVYDFNLLNRKLALAHRKIELAQTVLNRSKAYLAKKQSQLQAAEALLKEKTQILELSHILNNLEV